ncbi:MAG: hypothetical protein PW792_05895 [Acidobacteriaceae bacterium]|nr:hypothetical protein [Acidobacteriaceae bacterium]
MEEQRNEYQLFENRLKTLLPEEYRERYEAVQPTSMGSAGLKYGTDGRVAWNDIWGSFCDLAMAGGPPHRGKLLEPATKPEIDLEPALYREVVKELCRGISMVTRLIAEPSTVPGWIHVDCPGVTMAAWLARAINMENVSAHCQGMVLHLPAGPHFRLEKEVKNVITSIAKTTHYWSQHTSSAQHRAVANLLAMMDEESPFIQAPFSLQEIDAPDAETLRATIAAELQSQTGLVCQGMEYRGWLGIDCQSAGSAIWMMRLVVANNVICRREGDSIYVPVNPVADPAGARVLSVVKGMYSLAKAEELLS